MQATKLGWEDPVEATDPVAAAEVAQATSRFLVRLDRMAALLERMELDDHRMTALHRRAVVREFLLSARDCHRALDRFRDTLQGEASMAAISG
jgi:hypothetical protein